MDDTSPGHEPLNTPKRDTVSFNRAPSPLSSRRKPPPSFEAPPSPRSAMPSPPPSAGFRPRRVEARLSDDGSLGTLNFNRRPSVAASAPQADDRGHHAFTTMPARSGPLERRGSDHKRKPSISISTSLANSGANMGNIGGGRERTLLEGPKGDGLRTPATPSTTIPTMRATRAPMEAFASVDMLMGQKDAERMKGAEVFHNGRYEGRAVQPETLTSAKRVDPLEYVRSVRNGPTGTAAPILPPIDVGSVALSLRRCRSDEKKIDHDWRKRFGSVSSHAGPNSPSTDPVLVQNKNFSFPKRPHGERLPSSPLPASRDIGDEDMSSHHERPSFSSYDSDKYLGGGWRDEHIGKSEFSLDKPSIVALPTYPAPSGTTAAKVQRRAIVAKASIFTAILSQAFAIFYLYQRSRAMKMVEDKMPGVFVSGWLFLAFETSLALIVGIHTLWTVFSYRPTDESQKFRVRGEANLPNVDVLVVSSGQTDQVTFDCAVAAASIDYPIHKFRVLVLDPLNSTDLQSRLRVHAKSQGCPHLSYHRRTLNFGKGDVFHSKANSVNFGLMEAKVLGLRGGRGLGDYVAVFDADMIPERNFLRAALPKLLEDKKVALVQTPEGYINLPRRHTQPFATLMNAAEAKQSRSGFVLRTAALADIGGFPADSWIQDGHCAALLQGRGYKITQVEEVLQYGFAKPTYGSQVGSMMINMLGPLRTAARLGFFMRGSDLAMMSYSDRLVAVSKALLPAFHLLVLALTIMQPFMFAYGGILVLTPTLGNLTVLLQCAFANILVVRLHEFVWEWSTGLPSPRRKLQSWVFAAPYALIALLRLVFPGWMGGYVRGSDININAVTTPTRPTVMKRLGWFLSDPHTWIVAATLSTMSVGLSRAIGDFERGTVDLHQTALTLLLTVCWPSMLWLDFFFASIVPITCLLAPSRLLTETREAFLTRDQFSSVARPKHSFKTQQPFRTHRLPEFITGTAMIAWALTAYLLAAKTSVFA